MAKQLKYKVGDEWVSIKSEGINYDKTNNTDEDIRITNPNYTNESGNTQLYDALDDISDDINRLKRNVAWLAAHGGGGGSTIIISGNTQEDTSSYGIEIVGQNIVNNGTLTTEITDNTYGFKFHVTGASSSVSFTYTITIDGTASDTGTIKGGINSKEFTIEDFDSKDAHTISISVVTQSGIALSSFNFNVTDISITLTVEKPDTGRIEISSRNPAVNFTITNKLYGSTTTLHIKNLSDTSASVKEDGCIYEYTYTSKTTSAFSIAIPFTEICTTYKQNLHKKYKFSAYVTIDGTSTKTDEIIFYRTIISSNDLSIVTSNISTLYFEDGTHDSTYYKTTTTETFSNAETDGDLSIFYTQYLINFTYSCYLTTATLLYSSVVYYRYDDIDSVQFDNNGNCINYSAFGRISGSYFNGSTSEDYTDGTASDTVWNDTANNAYSPGSTISVNKNIEDDETGVYVIVIRSWYNNINNYIDSYCICRVDENENRVYSYQIPNRYSGIDSPLMFGRWNASRFNTQSNTFISTQTYSSDYYDSVSSTLSLSNNSNGITGLILTESDGNYFRFQNSCYGIIDLSDFDDELKSWYTSDSEGLINGFTLSFTLKIDEHPDNSYTVMYMGSNESNMIKIGTDEAYWVINGNELNIKIPNNKIITLDFVYKYNSTDNDTIACIYMNGIVSAFSSQKINTSTKGVTIGDKIYIGCDKDGNNFANFNLYDISLFGTSLNDVQLVVNSYLNRNYPYYTDYTEWMKKNFFDVGETDPTSLIYNNGTYDIETFSVSQIMTENSPLPIVYIDCKNAGFSNSIFSATYSKANDTSSRKYSGALMTYYDPTINKTISNINCSVSIQGTSSLAYRSKNIEVILTNYIDEAEEKPQLFQAKTTWLPENEFTLKADVVDSGHINNATIGRFINERCEDIIGEDPGMVFFNAHKPLVIDSSTGEYSEKTHNNVSVKNAIEGFPVLLVIKFAPEADETTNDVLLGIYSFNLGRNSYFNNGLKFLKGYGLTNNEEAPALVSYYDEYTGTVDDQNMDEIFSYEFNTNADDYEEDNEGNLIKPYPWTQYDESVLKYIGDVKYQNDGTSTDDMWKGLSTLFESFNALSNYSNTKFIVETSLTSDNETVYTYKSSTVKNPLVISDAAAYINEHLGLNGCSVYFINCCAFGLIDSLGKNMVLRTWDNGKTWWIKYYDMDSANALDNNGYEKVSPSAYIDGYENKRNYYYTLKDSSVVYSANTIYQVPTSNVVSSGYTDIDNTLEGNDRMNNLIITEQADRSEYAGKKSFLWVLLRKKYENSSESYLSHMGGATYPTYESLWSSMRSSNGILSSVTMFTNYIEEQMENCGELIYNQDYNYKYITKYKKPSQETATYGDSFALHGTRIEYIKKWLKQHFAFLDSILYTNKTTYTGTIQSSTLKKPCIFVRTNAPIEWKMQIDDDSYNYFIPEYTTTQLNLPSNQKESLTITINCTDNIIGLSDLSTMNLKGFTGAAFPNLASLDLSNSKYLTADGIVTNSNFIYVDEDGNKYSKVRSVNFKNAVFDSSKTLSFTGNDYKYNVLNSIDISNSTNIGGIDIPDVPLLLLDVTNSQINKLDLSNQSLLSTLSLNGCTKLAEITLSKCNGISSLSLNSSLGSLTSLTIEQCEGITTIDISDLDNLKYIYVNNCKNLLKISCTGCKNLEEVIITNNDSLKEIIINDSECKDIDIDITMNTNSLETLDFTNLDASAITLPERQYLSNVSNLVFNNCSYISRIFYTNDITETTGDENYDNAFDISPFTKINASYNNLDVTKCYSLKYIKVRYDEENPFKLFDKEFTTCNSITRIYGNICLCGNNIFTNCNSFYVNESDAYDENTYDIIEGYEHPTILSINTNNIKYCFSVTNCTDGDIHYIINKCDNVKIMSGLFSGCSFDGMVIEEPDIFKHLGNVTNMDDLFADTKLEITLYSDYNDVDNIDGTFSYVPNLETFNHVFYNCTVHCNLEDIDSWIFTEKNSKIKSIADFNSTSFNGESLNINADKLFCYLPNLTSITDSFNEMPISFESTMENERCDMFKYNTNLKIIYNSFQNLEAVSSEQSYLNNLFGGDTNEEDFYPNKLETIHSSFTFKSDDDYKWINLNLNDNFFRHTASTLKDLSGTNDYKLFSGDGINKYAETFPFGIFDGCVKLTSIGFFFTDLTIDDGSTINLPGNLFNDCLMVNSLEGCFYGVKFNYKLTANSFVNMSYLTNVSHMFGGSSKNGLTGGIPYGLFFRKYDSYPLTNYVGISHKTYESISNDSTILSNGNIQLSDSVKIEDITTEAFVEQYAKVPTRYLEKMDNIFEGTTLTVQPFKYDYASKLSEIIANEDGSYNFDNTDIIVYNTEYCPIEYTITEENGNVILTKNEQYNPYKYMWNKYVCDGGINNDFITAIENSALYAKLTAENVDENLLDDYGNLLLPLPSDTTYFPKEIQKDYLDTYKNTISDSGISGDLYYMCPPDLFTYAEDSNNTNISGAFSGSTGINGRIPEMLFDKFTSITSLEGMFVRVKIRAHKYPDENGDGGIMYPPILLSTLTKLTTIESMFAGTVIHGACLIGSEFFENNTMLTNISGLWSTSTWSSYKGKSICQINGSIFTNNKYLIKVSQMLQTSVMAYMTSSIFNPTDNNSITDVEEFMYGTRVLNSSSAPEFWNDYKNISITSGAYGNLNTTTKKNLGFNNITDEVILGEYFN